MSVRRNSSPRSICCAYAPASVGNTAVGFDTLGFALHGIGDVVTARKIKNRRDGRSRVVITGILGLSEDLPLDARKNTAAVAALQLLRDQDAGFSVELEIHKGIPSSAGMGGSAASAVAAVVAVNGLLARPLPRAALLAAALAGEAVASGSVHADNVAPSLLGGMRLTVSHEPLRVTEVPVPAGILCVLVHPALKIATRKARAILKRDVSLGLHIRQSALLAGFVQGCMMDDLPQLRATLRDLLIEPQRSPLIPGFDEAKQAALKNGAIGFSISGAGPSVFAWAASRSAGERVRRAVAKVFAQKGLCPDSWLLSIDRRGARVLR